MSSTTQRVLRNTISLYIRMLILTVISLFTVKLVLHALGEIDYGLYNVVGGFVTLFAFVSGTLTIASQRYFAISLASNDWKKLNKYFSVNLAIYVIFFVILFLVAETIGIWFVMNKLTIPAERMTSAIWLYQFSVANFALSLISSPYQALLIADENLTIYSIVSIVEGVFKILIVYILYMLPGDKLIIYSALLFIVSLVINFFYMWYCKTKYKNLKIRIQWDKEGYCEIFSYMNWNLIGAIGQVGKGQGINIIMNMFFGASINAARGIAMQINSVVASFSQNFMKAIDPQITKNYVNGTDESLERLINSSSKLAYYLLYIIILPLGFNMKYLLTLWLGNDTPEYTQEFAILALVDALALALTESLGTAVQATGRVKWYQIIVGTLAVLNLPVAYIGLKVCPNPLVPFIGSIMISICMSVGRICVYSSLDDRFKIKKYVINVVIPIAVTTVVSFCIAYVIGGSDSSFIQFICSVVLIVSVTAVTIMLIGLNKAERSMVIGFLPIVKKRKKL